MYTNYSQQLPYQSYQNPSELYHSQTGYGLPIPGVEAVPPPTPKVDYEAPVFQTFQERKRAKEMALRAKVGEASSPSTHTSSASPAPTTYSRGPPQQPPLQSHRSPSPISPSPSTLAMMGQPSPVGGPPAPPSRSRSPLPSPISQNGSPAPGTPAQHISTRPLPSPRALPSFPPISPGAMPNRLDTASPHTPRRTDMPPPPVPSPIDTNLERSDTVSSVRSLDRSGFSSSPIKRSLPKPPVGVNNSKSLDRGIPSTAGISMGDGFRKSMNRKQPPVVEEGNESPLVNGMNGMSIGSNRSISPTPLPSVRTPSPSSSITPPVIITPDSSFDDRAPAKFTPLPAINLPDSETSSAATTDDEAEPQDISQVTPKAKKTTKEPSSPGIQFSGLPVISVSTSDTADEPSQGREISFAVPTINFDDGLPSINIPPVTTPSSNAPPASSQKQHRIQPDGSAFLCSGCNNAIIGRIVNAMNQRWHPQCFMCAECGELLEHVSSYEWEGKAYCHLDFHDKFAHKCHHCQTPIVDARFVTLNDEILGQRYYHELHFFCSECGDPFLDPSKSSAPGTEKIRQNDEDDEDNETSAFVIQKGHPYCERCHLRLHKPKCKACTKPIPDLAINAMGAKWHQECFVCAQCHDPFANNLFFPQDGKAYCTSCYESIIAS
ncbi:uncharacterized protein L201_002465 [Kwoniella dendrophila CBS 6074]|uniref:LIM zinc-binding domain-containing protein n=1 Tax=Kwoniella dendrophila CBS 6074 TaxID=1295534 RepID=A0AAX4JSU8_9TREE